MEPGGISVARTLPIDGALLGDVLLRLRRDSAASSLRWTLGDRGAAEVDVCFTSAGAGWTTTARLWSRTSVALTPATVWCGPTGVDEVTLTLEPAAGDRSRGGMAASPPGLAELARAAVDELAEELLWHATRAPFTRSS
jgi:hypothetical protein